MNAEPVIVPDHLVEDLQTWNLDQQTPKDLFSQGESVQIKDGPFKNLEGNFLELLKGTSGESRALLLIQILGKYQKIKVPIQLIQKKS